MTSNLLSKFIFFIIAFSTTFATADSQIVPMLSLLLGKDVKPTFVSGQTSYISTSNITTDGGTIEFERGASLEGVKIKFNKGSLRNNSEVIINVNTGSIRNLKNASPSQVVIDIDMGDGQKIFNQLIEITAPFDGQEVPVPIYINENGSIHGLSVIDVDKNNNTFTFVSGHASLFSWLIPVARAPSSEVVVKRVGSNPNFRVKTNSFFVRNQATPHNDAGQCAGMASFSRWYYANKSKNEGGLYSKFRSKIGSTNQGKDILVQDVIASRAHIATTRGFFSNDAVIIKTIRRLPAKDRFWGIVNMMNVLNEPVMLYLGDLNFIADDVYHSVVAIGYKLSDLGSEIYVYDPNVVDSEKIIEYDTLAEEWESFKPYGRDSYNFNLIALYGDGVGHISESYENILKDAKNNFNGTNKATINITSHNNGQTVNHGVTTLNGNVSSGDILVNQIGVIVNAGNSIQERSVGADGAFSIPVTLQQGENKITFKTSGIGGHGTTVDVPNDKDTLDYILALESGSEIIRLTLEWDTNYTDLDLYVIDPTGDYSYFGKKQTNDGGELDYDVTNGFGPENWVLEATDTIRYNGTYKVRVHNFGFNSNINSTNFSVAINFVRQNGQRETYTHHGVFTSDGGSSAFNGTGSSWVDVAEFSLSGVEGAALTRIVPLNTIHVKETLTEEERLYQKALNREQQRPN